MADEIRVTVALDMQDRLTPALNQAAEASAGAFARIASFGQRLAAIGTVAAGIGGNVGRMVDGFATLGNEVQSNSERLGVGVGWLQEWQYAARQFGADNGALVSGLKELSLQAEEFLATGGSSAAESFKRLGIGAEDLQATAGDTEKLLELVASRLGRIEASAAPRVIGELFGRDGEQLITLLRQSGDELDRLRQAGRDNGAIISDEDVEQSRLYIQQMNQLTSTLQSIKNTVLGALLPTINQWLGSLNELSQANRQAISQQIVQGLQQLAAGIQALASAFTWVAGMAGGFVPLITLVAELMAGRFVFSLFSGAVTLLQFGSALGEMASKWIPLAIDGIRALSVALFTTPIGWIVLGITALAGAAYLIYSNWGAIAEWFAGLWAQIRAFFDQGIGAILQGLLAFTPAAQLLKAVDAVFELFAGRSLSQLGRDWIGGLASGIGERFEQLTSWLRQKIGELTLLMPDWVVKRLGLQRPDEPEAAASTLSGLGQPLLGNRQSPLLAPRYTDVGGELRIRIDADGNPRVSSMKANGGLGYSLDSGLLGVMA